MSKQHKRPGRLGRLARQFNASEKKPPLQKWDDEKKIWVRQKVF